MSLARRSALLGVALWAILLAACAVDDGPTPTSSSTMPATATTVVGSPTSTVEVTPTETPTETPQPPSRAIGGLFLEPRGVPEPDARASVAERPASPFEPWDRLDVVLYDRTSMTETNLGPGTNALFSPKVEYLAWAAGDGSFARDLWVLDLATGERRELGRGQPQRWMNDNTLIAIDPGTGARDFIDVLTGEYRPAGDADPSVAAPREQTAGNWVLRREPIEGREDEYPLWESHFELLDTTGQLGPLEFEAYEAALSPDGTLWLATAPQSGTPLVEEGPHLETGIVNLFEVEPVSAEARFIASAAASAPNWPFSASRTHLAWTEDFCSLEPTAGRTRLYERASDSITELDRGYWLEFTADALLGVDAFGPRALIDVTTLEYTFVLPDGALDVLWSPDDRYAVLAFVGGHGGLCG